jgi:hypothetical protein
VQLARRRIANGALGSFRLEHGVEPVVAAPEKRRYQMVMHEVKPGWTITKEWEGYTIEADITFRDMRVKSPNFDEARRQRSRVSVLTYVLSAGLNGRVVDSREDWSPKQGFPPEISSKEPATIALEVGVRESAKGSPTRS